MRKVIILSIFIVFIHTPAFSQEIYIGKDGNIRNIETRAITIDDGEAYLATPSALYRINDISRGDKWQEIFSLPAGENEINSLSVRGKAVFLGTKRGLFKSEDGGKSWHNVFRTIIPDKNNILSIDISRYNPKKIVISTAKGVFLSEDSGSKWADISANLKNKRIKRAALNKDVICAAGDDGLYIKKTGETAWERVYVNTSSQSADSAESEAAREPSENEEGSSAVNCVTIKGQRIYIGVNKNISCSDDEGRSWQAIPGYGLAGTVNYILPSRNTEKLYCATTKGVFEFRGKADGWAELYKGMDRAASVSEIVFCGDDERALWALTEKGLYRLEAGRYSTGQYADIENNLKSFKIIFDNEPSFAQLRNAAMKFCDVSPEKIRGWQRDSKLKAIVPKVSMGIGSGRSSNTEIYTSATKDYAVVGPDDYSDKFDFSVSWDLGNIIWSDSQTSIDVRSRLNTQLRNDILDDLRRAYYERKRLQFDLMTEPPKDAKSRFERELRIQELTQSIDDLTGNYLSDHMKEKGEVDKG